MTSAEIKQALTMTIQLAPAIARAGEIVESAEHAEQLLLEMQQRKQAAEKELAGLRESGDLQRKALADLAAEVEGAKRDAASQKQGLSKAVADAAKNLESAQAALEASRQEHAAFLKTAEKERQTVQSQLDGLKHELDALVTKLRS